MALFSPEESNAVGGVRSEEHTSELQSRSDLVCRLLLEKKKEAIRAQQLFARPKLRPDPPSEARLFLSADRSPPATSGASRALPPHARGAQPVDASVPQ